MQTARARTIPKVRGLIPMLVVVAVTFLSGEGATAAESKRSPKPAPADAVATPTPVLAAAATTTSEVAPAQSATPTTPSLEGVKVIDVYKLGNVNEKEIEKRNSARLQEIIVVTVRNLENLTKTSKCLSEDNRAVPNCNPQPIALFLDGRLIKGIVPESGAPRIDETSHTADPNGILQFHLQRNADSDEAWADLLGAPPASIGFFKRPTEVSVGLENGYALPTDIKVPATDLKHQFMLIRIDQFWFIVCLVLLVAVLVFLFFLAWYSELLRDLGPVPPTDGDPNAGWWQTWWRDRKKRKHKPYSLARFQMAFWFFLLMASFLFIWLITGANDTITGSTLALIGIGAGTALGAAAIDATKAGDGGANRPISVSQGFLTDVLSDRVNGISFHRFQMLIWTLVLGILFIYSVWYRLSMPEFSATLLALLGISSGTYLGFKIPENQSPPAKTE